MKRSSVFVLLCMALASWIASAQVCGDQVTQCKIGPPPPGFQAVPLSDWTPSTPNYLNQFQGYLYNGSNTMLAAHDADGRSAAAQIQPLDTRGRPSSKGKIVLLTIGMSNNTIESCGANQFNSDGDPCATACVPPYNQTQSFMGQAAADSTVNHTTLVIADGAKGSQTLGTWDPAGPSGYSNYNRVASQVLAPQGLTEQQVQSIWLKDSDAKPDTSLPSTQADAYIDEQHLGNIIRANNIRYPNAQQVFLTRRIYAGYAISCLDPEPYAYESGFSVKWAVTAQINQVNLGGPPDPIAGNLNYSRGHGRVVAPWVAWGPYLWASGNTPRSDNLVWCNAQSGGLCNGEEDFRLVDLTHPNTNGEMKVGTLLLTFMKNSPYTTWFLASGK